MSMAAKGPMRSLPAVMLAGLVAAGCASAPNPRLDAAQAAVERMRTDPQVAQQAPIAVDEAELALQRAIAAYEGGEDEVEVNHLAYVAMQRAAAAEAVAAEKQAQNQISSLGERRGEIQLQAANERARQLERQLAELQARQTERGYVLTLGDILFDVDGANLQPGGMQQLARLADFLRQNPGRAVLVEGHTDSTGNDAYNLQLSEARARAVENYLLTQGIAPQRIIARGYGSQFPVATNDTTAGRQQNRRVEIVILGEGQAPVPRA